MVSYIRCPYCGHSKVDRSLSNCPICDGELISESSVHLDEASESTNKANLSLDLDALLSEPPMKHAERRSYGEIELSEGETSNAAVELSDSLPRHIRLDEERMPPASTENQLGVQVKSNASISAFPLAWKGSAIQLYFVLVFILFAVWIHYAPAESSSVDRAETSHTQVIKQGLQAIEEERYAAAIGFLEKATEDGKNSWLLPSLALAYSKTTQVERSRQVIKRYRSLVP